MARKTAGLDSGLVSDAGGSERVTIAANIGSGADVPCRKVFITQPAGNTGQVRLNIGAAASATLGINIPKGATTAANGPGEQPPLELNIANTNLLNFYSGTNGDTVDIMYLK